MKKFTCTLALLLALLFGLSCLQPSALAAEGVAWNGIPATSFSGGSGTESDPYLISNGGELAYLAQKVNESNSTSNPYRGAWYRLTADIDLGNQEWTPIGWNASAPYYFCGTFIGGGHTISHLKISGNVNYAGLFGSLANASICNLTLRDSSIVSSGYRGRVRWQYGRFPGNPVQPACGGHHRGGKYAVGGIVGYASAGSGYTITLCCSSVQGRNHHRYPVRCGRRGWTGRRPWRNRKHQPLLVRCIPSQLHQLRRGRSRRHRRHGGK